MIKVQQSLEEFWHREPWLESGRAEKVNPHLSLIFNLTRTHECSSHYLKASLSSALENNSYLVFAELFRTDYAFLSKAEKQVVHISMYTQCKIPSNRCRCRDAICEMHQLALLPLKCKVKVMYVTGWKQKCDVWKQAWNSGVDFDIVCELGFSEKREGILMHLKYSFIFLKREMYWDTSHTMMNLDKFSKLEILEFQNIAMHAIRKLICTAAVITKVQNPLPCKGICVCTGLANLHVWQVNRGCLLFQHQRQCFNNTSFRA